MEYIALDVHKKYTWARVENDKETGATRVDCRTLRGRSKISLIVGRPDIR
jgi:hypothetical protein